MKDKTPTPNGDPEFDTRTLSLLEEVDGIISRLGVLRIRLEEELASTGPKT